jgi:hypothetical protein
MKYKLLCDELAKRLADTTYKIYKKELIGAWINSAMDKLFSDTWVASGGEKEKFTQVLPELLSVQTTPKQTGYSSIQLNNVSLRIFEIFSGIIDGRIIKIWDNNIYHRVLVGDMPYHHPTNEEPAMFQFGNKLEFLPINIAGTVSLMFIENPSVKADGTKFTYDNQEEILYTDKWFPTIVDTAEMLAKKDTQESL